MNGSFPPTPEDILALARGPRLADMAGKKARARTLSWPDVVEAYLGELGERFGDRRIDRLHVAVDPGNGCLAGIASSAFRQCGAEVAAIHDTVDGLFRERHPDCAIAAHLTALQQTVIDRRSDLGIAFDGDGDRIAVVDGKGRVLGAERLAMILLQGPLRPAHGDRVVLDVKCSMHLDRLIRRLGGEGIRCKSGHAYMKRTVLERGALAGVEISGHIFLGSLGGRDDPLHTALLLAAWLAGAKTTLAELVDELPPMFMTEDIRVALPASAISHIIAVCAQGLGGGAPEHVDGVRLVWPDGWLLARRSITEAKITIRLEGETPAALGRIGALFAAAIPEVGQQVTRAIGNVPDVRRHR